MSLWSCLSEFNQGPFNQDQVKFNQHLTCSNLSSYFKLTTKLEKRDLTLTQVRLKQSFTQLQS